MKIQRIGICTNNYLSIGNQQSNSNPNFGMSKKAVVEGPDVLATIFEEPVLKQASPYLTRWTQFLASRGAIPTYERTGDRLSVSVSGASSMSGKNGNAITNLNSWTDLVKALAKASRDYVRGNELALAYDSAATRHPILV